PQARQSHRVGRRRSGARPYRAGIPFANDKTARIRKPLEVVPPARMATAAPELRVLSRDQAFQALYRRYVKDVYHYALALLRNPADAEDVTQTTFLNAYRAYTRGIQVENPR